MNKKFAWGILLPVLFLSGCATQVIRKDTTEIIDLSGRWNDTDSRLTAEEMIKQCLDSQWISDFNKVNGRDPVIIIGTVVNRSSEHINTQVFVQDLATSLTNSGKAKFVAAKGERDEVREERLDQQENARAETRAALKAETGADYMLKGVLNSVVDQTKGKFAVFYQVNLELIDMTTNEKVWIGQKKIKKLVKNAKYSL